MTLREPFPTIVTVTGDEVPSTLLPLTLGCAEAGGVRPVAVWEAFPMLLAFLRIEEAEKWVMAL